MASLVRLHQLTNIPLGEKWRPIQFFLQNSNLRWPWKSTTKLLNYKQFSKSFAFAVFLVENDRQLENISCYSTILHGVGLWKQQVIQMGNVSTNRANIQTKAMFCSFCQGGRGWPENQEVGEQNLGWSWREQHCGEDADFRPPGPSPKWSLDTIHHCFPWHFQAQVHVYTLRNHDNKYMALEFEQVFPLSNGGTLVNST